MVGVSISLLVLLFSFPLSLSQSLVTKEEKAVVPAELENLKKNSPQGDHQIGVIERISTSPYKPADAFMMHARH
jgi:hypothetical protein